MSELPVLMTSGTISEKLDPLIGEFLQQIPECLFTRGTDKLLYVTLGAMCSCYVMRLVDVFLT